jgi:hypothetical protein
MIVTLVFVIAQIVEVPSSAAAFKPRFAEFAVHERFTARPAPAILSTSEARNFRTVLREGARNGPNFAGHFTIVQWGCGTQCWEGAVVDGKTGRVFQLPSLDKTRDSFFESTWLHFQPDSRLLIMCTNCRLWADRECDQRYFVWNGDSFKEIRRQPQHDPHQH